MHGQWLDDVRCIGCDKELRVRLQHVCSHSDAYAVENPGGHGLH
jgi:hypothetical protein